MKVSKSIEGCEARGAIGPSLFKLGLGVGAYGEACCVCVNRLRSRLQFGDFCCRAKTIANAQKIHNFDSDEHKQSTQCTSQH
eukprot:scaffold2058_cov158-Alexandrium_tamarense.AAC.10